MPSPNYGPAGIFSTDSPTSDAMQIAEEQGPWDEDGFFDEEILAELAEGFPEQVKLYGCCPECFWWDSAHYWSDNPAGLEGAKARLCREHHGERFECKGALEFG